LNTRFINIILGGSKLKFIIDIIIAAIIIGSVFLGYKRGFIKTVARPVKFFLCLALSFSLASPFAAAFIEPIIDDTVSNQIADYLDDKIEESETGELDIPTLLLVAAEIADVELPETVDTKEFANEIADTVAGPVIHLLASIVSFIVLYFVLKIVLGILLKMLNAFFDRGVAGALNRTLGVVFSLLLSIATAYLFVSVFEFVRNMPIFESVAWLSDFDGGFLYNFFGSLNPIDLLLSF
jgi:uncharacterized membrane protein required for colicin V production